MPQSQISYAGQPWTAGATWLVNNAGNFGNQVTADFTNASGANLYLGDVVVLGQTGTIPDPAAFFVTSTTTVSSPYVVGVVGGAANVPGQGGAIPLQDVNWRYDTVSPTASATVNDANAVVGDVGKAVIGAGIPSGAYIVSVVAGTSFTMNVAATAGTNVVLAIGPQTSSLGPGYVSTASPYIPGMVVPVVTEGWAYVNVGTNAVVAGGLLATSATARVANTIASGATLIGTFIGVVLEPPGTLGSGDGTTNKLVRAYIDKM